MNTKHFPIFLGIVLTILLFTALGCGGGGGGGSGSGSEKNPIGPGTETPTPENSEGNGSESSGGSNSNGGSNSGSGSNSGNGSNPGSNGDNNKEDESAPSLTWKDLSLENRSHLIAKWENYEEKEKISGSWVTKTWIDKTNNNLPSIEFTDDYKDSLGLGSSLKIKNSEDSVNNPQISTTVYFENSQIASDTANKWTIGTPKTLLTFYTLDVESSSLYFYLDPDEKEEPDYEAF